MKGLYKLSIDLEENNRKSVISTNQF